MPIDLENDPTIKKLQDILDKELKNIFQVFILPDYLIQVRDELEADERYLNVLNTNSSQILNRALHMVGGENLEYELCKYIAMSHAYYNVGRSSNHVPYPKDEEYKKKLIDSALLEFKLKTDFDLVHSEYSLMAYMPLNYIIRCVTYHLIEQIREFNKKTDDNVIPNKDFRLNSIFNMLENINGILSLYENGDYASASALIRILVQIFATYIIIGDNEDVAKQYYQFSKWAEEKTNSTKKGWYPDEFNKIKPHLSHGKGVGRQQFIMFGWLDFLGKEHKEYSMKGIFAYIPKEYKKRLNKIYKENNKYIHGQYRYDEFNNFYFMHGLDDVGYMLKIIASDVVTFTEKELLCGDVNLREELDKILQENKKIYDTYKIREKKDLKIAEQKLEEEKI